MKTVLNIYLKLIVFINLFTLASIPADLQRTTSVSQYLRNEFKANLLGLAIGLPELSYERLINQNMGIGISAAGIQHKKGDRQAYKFMFTPPYHHYFDKKYASGFFLEANAVVFSNDVAQGDDVGLPTDKIYDGLGGGIGMNKFSGRASLPN